MTTRGYWNSQLSKMYFTKIIFWRVYRFAILGSSSNTPPSFQGSTECFIRYNDPRRTTVSSLHGFFKGHMSISNSWVESTVSSRGTTITALHTQSFVQHGMSRYIHPGSSPKPLAPRVYSNLVKWLTEPWQLAIISSGCSDSRAAGSSIVAERS